jgi:hypothetical protein
MESTTGQSKPKSKLNSLPVLAIIVAAVADECYYISTSPSQQFSVTAGQVSSELGYEVLSA